MTRRFGFDTGIWPCEVSDDMSYLTGSSTLDAYELSFSIF
jgi:hypothetical protein